MCVCLLDSIKITKTSRYAMCVMWDFCFDLRCFENFQIELTKLRICSIVQSILRWLNFRSLSFEFLLLVLASIFSRSNLTSWFNHYVGLHCCFCFSATIFRPASKCVFQRIKMKILTFLFQLLQNRISNSTLRMTSLTKNACYPFGVYVCTRTLSVWVLTNN